MKNIISCFALTILLFACSKREQPLPSDQETSLLKKGGGSGPTVTTTAATIITSATATSGGTVSTSGGGNNVTERGVCFNTSPNPTIFNLKVPSGSGAGSFISILSGLDPSTTYYVRAYATKSTGTTYGNQISFITLPNYGSVTDIDGNVYNTITIGSQVWTLENLKTTRYRDGTLIPDVTGNTAWAALTSGAYCNYDNDEGNVATYGRLYNWYAVADAHNLAPAGYHIPSLAEWDILRNYLGGVNVAGGKAKEAGLAHWLAPNTGADNSSGFTALPSGVRYLISDPAYTVYPADYEHLGSTGDWWTSSDYASNPGNAPFIEVDNTSIHMYRQSFGPGIGYYDKRTGYSVRCVKDQVK